MSGEPCVTCLDCQFSRSAVSIKGPNYTIVGRREGRGVAGLTPIINITQGCTIINSRLSICMHCVTVVSH